MYPSVTLCRAQEMYQRDRAAKAELPHARIVAARAATAWGKEALVAEGREERRRRSQAVADSMSLRSLREIDRWCSENPDRESSND